MMVYQKYFLIILFLSSFLFTENILVTDIKYEGVSKMYASQIRSAIDSAVDDSEYTAVGRDIGEIDSEKIQKIIKKNKLVNTRLMLSSSCSISGEMLSLNISIIHVESGAILYSGTAKVDGEEIEKLSGEISSLLEESYSKVDSGRTEKSKAGLTAAVIDFTPLNCPKVESVIITDLLREKMIRQGRFTIINRANMKAILEEQSFQASGCTTEECKVQLGQLLNASRVISGELRKLNDEYLLTVKMLDVETGKFINMAKCTIQDISDAGRDADLLAQELSESFAERLSALNKKRKNSLRGVFLTGGGVLLAGSGMALFHALGRNGTTEAEGIYSSYLSSTVSSEAAQYGADLDKTVKKSDAMYNLRDTCFTLLYLAAVYEIIAVIRYSRINKRYIEQSRLKLALDLSTDQKAFYLSREF